MIYKKKRNGGVVSLYKFLPYAGGGIVEGCIIAHYPFLHFIWHNFGWENVDIFYHFLTGLTGFTGFFAFGKILSQTKNNL